MSIIGVEYYKGYVDKIVEFLADTEDPETELLLQIIKNAKLNNILENLINRCPRPSEGPSIKISNFQLSRLSNPCGYDEWEGYFIDDMSPLTLNEIAELIPLSISISYDLEIHDLSRIKIKGSGDIKIERKGDELKIEASDTWSIEEVTEMDVAEPNIIIKFIKDLGKQFIIYLVVEFAKYFI